jgi:hypothetical protein
MSPLRNPLRQVHCLPTSLRRTLFAVAALGIVPSLLGCGPISSTNSATTSASQDEFLTQCRASSPPVMPTLQTRCEPGDVQSVPATGRAEQEAESLWQLLEQLETSYPFESSALESLLGVELALRRNTEAKCYYRSIGTPNNRTGVRLFEVEFVPGSSSPAGLTLHLEASQVSIAAAEAWYPDGHGVPPPPPYPGMENYGPAYFVQRPWGVLSFGACSGGLVSMVAFSPGDTVPNGV